MKHFLIRYRRTAGTEAQWHQDMAAFIAALEADPVLKGKIGYRCMKIKDSSDYYHIASPTDDGAIKALQSREFFKRYTDQTKAVAGGAVEVLPLEVIVETSRI
jgi:hypothetical protein